MVKTVIGLLALVLSSPVLAQPSHYRYDADTVDINQGVYVCDKADIQTLNRLNAEHNDIKRRGAVAKSLGCQFHIGPVSDDYQAEEYPVVEQVAGVCYQGGTDYCDEQAFAVTVYMQGKLKAIVSLWLDEDRN